MIDAQLERSFPKSILPCAERTHDRRASNRLPIERDVHYKVLDGKKTVKYVGSGKSLNMSSGGVLFTTASSLREGERIELAVSWPAKLDDRIPMKLVAIGVLVRTHETQAAMSIERYQFKTHGIDL